METLKTRAAQLDPAQTPSSRALVDRFGRAHTSMRVSVTDRCNLRCLYCMPAEGVEYAPREQLLSTDALAHVVRVAARLGIRRVRITGGEPLLRAELPQIISRLRRQTAVEDIALTTNGVLLARHADALADAGLDRINISLDSLDAARFEAITRFGGIEDVWRGLEAAAEAGLRPIKLNTLLIEGFNDDEIDRWIELVRTRDITVRFMELMPVGDNALAELGGYYDLTRLRERLQAEVGLRPATQAHVGNGPARYWTAPGWRGRLGFITPISNPYCNACSRMRLTSTGDLRACLAFDEHVNLAHAARRGDESAIEAALRWAVETKRQGHHWREGQRTATGMSEFGG